MRELLKPSIFYSDKFSEQSILWTIYNYDGYLSTKRCTVLRKNNANKFSPNLAFVHTKYLRNLRKKLIFSRDYNEISLSHTKVWTLERNVGSENDQHWLCKWKSLEHEYFKSKLRPITTLQITKTQRKLCSKYTQKTPKVRITNMSKFAFCI